VNDEAVVHSPAMLIGHPWGGGKLMTLFSVKVMLLQKLFFKSCIEKASTFQENCKVCYRICYRFKAGSSYSFVMKMEYLMELKN